MTQQPPSNDIYNMGHMSRRDLTPAPSNGGNDMARPMLPQRDLASYLRTQRNEAHRTQEMTAQLGGIQYSLYVLWESGEETPSRTDLDAFWQRVYPNITLRYVHRAHTNQLNKIRGTWNVSKKTKKKRRPSNRLHRGKFSQMIYDLRMNAGIRQSEVVKGTGLSRYPRWEQGKTISPNPGCVDVLAKFFKLTPGETQVLHERYESQKKYMAKKKNKGKGRGKAKTKKPQQMKLPLGTSKKKHPPEPAQPATASALNTTFDLAVVTATAEGVIDLVGAIEQRYMPVSYERDEFAKAVQVGLTLGARLVFKRGKD